MYTYTVKMLEISTSKL